MQAQPTSVKAEQGGAAAAALPHSLAGLDAGGGAGGGGGGGSGGAKGFSGFPLQTLHVGNAEVRTRTRGRAAAPLCAQHTLISFSSPGQRVPTETR